MKAHWVIGIVMAAGLCAEAQDCNVDVYMAVPVRLPMRVMLEAQRTATQMFREIGVNVRMKRVIPTHDPDHACGAPMVIQFEDAAEYHGPAESLAYALPYGKSGASIHVFLDSILSNRDPRFASALLAHVMAHEITHMLENTGGHSAEGIMKSRWSREDYQRMERNPLPFAPQDVDLIRMGLARRITLAVASTNEHTLNASPGHPILRIRCTPMSCSAWIADTRKLCRCP